MIEEAIPVCFDILRLQEHVRLNVLPLPPVMAGNFFGGWSVLSSNGLYTDGWAGGHKLYDPDFLPGLSMSEKASQLGVKPSAAYVKPTEICTGYLAEVMAKIAGLGLEPRRARLTLLKAHGQSVRHTDGEPGEYCVRLHIPIFTDQACTFETDDESAHLAATGQAYLIHVNRMHQVFNRGDNDRIHLIMDVCDHAQISRHHRYHAPSQKTT